MEDIIKAKEKLVAAHCENESERQWYLRNIPFFDCPDQHIQEVYYYRWFLYKYHIVKSSRNGYLITEFSAPVRHSGVDGTISCAAGHHIYEGRWLRNQVYLNDYEKFWLSAEAEPRKYSFWLADAFFKHYLVSGNLAHLASLFDGMVRNYLKWEAFCYDEDYGLFWQIPDRDGMEWALTALSYGNGHGGEGYRPTINSYMYGDAVAISKIAKLLGRTSEHEEFNEKATIIKENVEQKLWNSQKEFFVDRRRDNRCFVDGRELVGFIPWYFHMPAPKFSSAWKYVVDQDFFRGRYGLRTLEKNHPDYLVEHNGKGTCMWNGFSWPYATAQTLTAMANLLHDYEQEFVCSTDYFALLKEYALCQYKNGEPYTAECYEPDAGYWYVDRGEKSQHYNHSTYCDLVISGLLGIRPDEVENVLRLNPLVPETWPYFCIENVEYRGHTVTVCFDSDGQRYGRGKGFNVYVDDKLVLEEEVLTTSVRIEL